MMRTRTFVGLLLSAALVCPLAAWSGIARAADDGKIRIAVVDFDTEAIHNTWQYSWSYNNLARAAADDLTSQLVKSGKFRVIERQQLDKILQEQNLGLSGRVDPSTAARIGKILGVQLVVIGSVVEFGIDEKGGHIPQIGKWKWGSGVGGSLVTGKAKLTARLVDTSTAEILGAYDGAGTHRFGKGEFSGASFGTNWDSGIASKVLSEAVDKLASDIAGKASSVEPSTVRGGVEGKIAKVGGSEVYVNVGGADGVKPGDRFEVRSLGEAIKDPETGESLGAVETTAGTIEITKVVNDRLSIAKVVSGSGFKVGDRIVMQ